MTFFIQNTCSKAKFNKIRNNHKYYRINADDLNFLSIKEMPEIINQYDVGLCIMFDRIDNNNIYLSICEIDNFA